MVDMYRLFSVYYAIGWTRVLCAVRSKNKKK